MKLRKVVRNTALILLLLASAMPAGAREERTARKTEAAGWGRVWTVVVDWVAKRGWGIDPNGLSAPVDEGEEAQADLGPEIDPNGRM